MVLIRLRIRTAALAALVLAILAQPARAGSGSSEPSFEWQGQEYPLSMLPDPPRAVLQGSPNIGAIRAVDLKVEQFPKACDKANPKDCQIFYDQAPVGSEKLCQGARTQLGALLSCAERELQSYQRMTELALEKSKNSILSINALLPAAEQIDWAKDVEPKLQMADRGWASGERKFADKLRDRVLMACSVLQAGDARDQCESLAQTTRSAVLEHAAKGVVYDHAVHIEDALWKSHNLPDELKVVVEADSGGGRAPKTAAAPRGGMTLRPTKGGDLGSLAVCAEFIPPFKLGAEQARCIQGGQEMEFFQKDIERVMGFSSIMTYIDLLRLEAVTSTLKAYREQYGSMPHLPAECDKYKPGLQKANEAPVPQETAEFYRSPEYFALLQRGARIVDGLSREAAMLKDIPPFKATPPIIAGGGREFRDNPEAIAAKARLHEIESGVADIFGKFPLLQAFHESGSKSYDGNKLGPLLGADPRDPVHMPLVIRDARQKNAADLTRLLARYCDDEQAGWDELVADGGLTASVLDKFPQFKPFQDCASDAAQKDGLPKEMLMAGIGLAACSVSLAGPQAVMGGMLACGSAQLAIVAGYTLDADERLLSSEQCRSAGDAICSRDDYLAARAAYESAVDTLFVSGILSAIDLATVAKMLKAQMSLMTTAELATTSAKIRQIAEAGVGLSATDSLALITRIEEVSKLPEGERIVALRRTLEDALVTQNTNMIVLREVQEALKGSEDDFVAVLAKRYGVSATDPDVLTLVRAAKARLGSAAAKMTVEEEAKWIETILAACRRL